MKILTLPLIAFFSFTHLYAEAPAINAPLRADEQKSVEAVAPILVAPNFKEGRDNLIPFDFDTKIYLKGSKTPVGTISTRDNEANNQHINSSTPAVVHFDYIEIGGASSYNFLFYRPSSSLYGFFGKRAMDTESAIIHMKKERVGPTAEVGFNFKTGVVVGNAHGDAATAACTKDMESCLLPDFNPTLASYMKGQTVKRTIEKLDGRVVLVSEDASHPIVAVSDVTRLVSNIDPKSTVVYFPKGADVAETKKKFSGARFVEYTLASKELAFVMIDNKDQNITAGGGITSAGDVKDWWGRKVENVSGIKSQFQDSKGGESGANPYFGWGVTSCMKDGKRIYPKSRNDNERIDCPNVHLILEKSFVGFFTEDEIKQGALKIIRNPWMKLN